MIDFVLSLVTKNFNSWFSDFKETKKIKVQAGIERSKLHLSGYSDEFLLIVWSYPFVSLFIPKLTPYTVTAFNNLSLLPDWYVGGFITISFSVFGIDKLFKWRLKK